MYLFFLQPGVFVPRPNTMFLFVYLFETSFFSVVSILMKCYNNENFQKEVVKFTAGMRILCVAVVSCMLGCTVVPL